MRTPRWKCGAAAAVLLSVAAAHGWAQGSGPSIYTDEQAIRKANGARAGTEALVAAAATRVEAVAGQVQPPEGGAPER